MDKRASEGDRASAERRMNEWLARHGKKWEDIPEILAQAARDNAAAAPPPPPSDPTRRRFGRTDPSHGDGAGARLLCVQNLPRARITRIRGDGAVGHAHACL